MMQKFNIGKFLLIQFRLNDDSLKFFLMYRINNFTYRRYTNFPSDFSSGAQIAWLLLAKVILTYGLYFQVIYKI
jgi:hypothetical protein